MVARASIPTAEVDRSTLDEDEEEVPSRNELAGYTCSRICQAINAMPNHAKVAAARTAAVL
jgi:hypothetical protein